MATGAEDESSGEVKLRVRAPVPNCGPDWIKDRVVAVFSYRRSRRKIIG
jgi:hypothetical protein